jgi:hypothetical protein
MIPLADPARVREKAAIDRLRGISEMQKGDDWTIEASGNSVRVIVCRATGEDALICAIHADALDSERELICGAFDNLSFFLRLFDRAAGAVRELKRQIDRQDVKAQEKNYSAQAAMLLSDRSFQRFLEIKGAGGPVRDKASADTRLKSLLAISSKRQINADERACRAFLALRADFEAWKRGASS